MSNILPIARTEATLPTKPSQRIGATNAVGRKDQHLNSRLHLLGLECSTVTNAATGRAELALVARIGVDLDAALGEVDLALAPAPKREIGKWLTALRAITVHRAAGDADVALIAQIYTERLGAFPADVVEHVLLRERWKFWPTIAELEERCDALSARRRLIALYLRTGHIRQPEPPRQRVSAERCAEILAERGLSSDCGRSEGRPDQATDTRGGWKRASASNCVNVERESL